MNSLSLQRMIRRALVVGGVLTAAGCMISPTNGQLYNFNEKVTFSIMVPWPSSWTEFVWEGGDGQLHIVADCLVDHAPVVRTDSAGQKWYECSVAVPFSSSASYFAVGALPGDAPSPPAGARFAARITSRTKAIDPDTGIDPIAIYSGLGVDTGGSCFLQEAQAKAPGLQIYGDCGVKNTYIFFR
jgi:hypothetical protein